MKKSTFLLVLFLVFILATTTFASLKEKQQELAVIRNEIQGLDLKIKDAKKFNRQKDVNEFRKEKAVLIKQAAVVKLAIEKFEGQQNEVITNRAGFKVEGGYGAGAILMGIGYTLPFENNLGLRLDGNYYFGNQYSVVNASLNTDYWSGMNFWGVGLGLAAYSQRVTDILGVSGVIGNESRININLCIGKIIEDWRLELGYGTVLGVQAKLGYKF